MRKTPKRVPQAEWVKILKEILDDQGIKTSKIPGNSPSAWTNWSKHKKKPTDATVEDLRDNLDLRYGELPYCVGAQKTGPRVGRRYKHFRRLMAEAKKNGGPTDEEPLDEEPKKKILTGMEEETCPDCGGPMKPTEARAGGWFWGCKDFPRCRGWRPGPKLVSVRAGSVDEEAAAIVQQILNLHWVTRTRVITSLQSLFQNKVS